ncbi:hypothetical protein CFC21_056627, partial [Triticum aestivum]
ERPHDQVLHELRQPEEGGHEGPRGGRRRDRAHPGRRRRRHRRAPQGLLQGGRGGPRGDGGHPRRARPPPCRQRGGQVAAPARRAARHAGPRQRRHRRRARPRARDPARARGHGRRQRRVAQALRGLPGGHHARPHSHLRHRGPPEEAQGH